MIMRTVSILLLVAIAVSLVGCSWGQPRNFANENDRLRRENLELRDTVADLQQRTDSLERALDVQRARAESPAAELPQGVHAPMVTRIHIGRFSGGIDTNGDGADDAVRLYLNTLDARNRFVPAVARARVTVAAVRDEEALTIGTASFDAGEFEQAYRSGLAGTHYTLIVPVTEAVPEDVSQVVVRVHLTDLLTNATHETQATVRWDSGPARPAAEAEASAATAAP